MKAKKNKCSAVAETDDRLATIDMGRKVRVAVHLRGAGSPSNTMSPGPRPTCTPSCVLIYPTVCHNTPTYHAGQTGQTDRQDNGAIA